jgi:ABC-type transport system substrate-binding protein
MGFSFVKDPPMRLATLPLLLAPLFLSLHAQAGPLTVCTEASPEGFDVVQYNSLTTTNASADVLMNRLVEFSVEQGKVVPSLADKWTISADGRTYEFKLHPGVKFHHTGWFSPTRELNASDVLFSFQRMLDPANPWHKVAQSGFPHAQSMQLPSLIKSIEAPDPLTVRFTLDHPDSTFLATLSMGFASIYSAEYADQLLKAGTPEKMNTQPVGSGPFEFVRFQKDAAVRYKANPDYFAGKPAIDPLIFAITPEPSVRLQKLRANECQLTLSPKPLDIAAAADDDKIQVIKTAAFMTAFVAINSQHPPFDKPEVRQAINLAFDKPGYLKAVFEGTAEAASGPYPANTWSFAKDLPGYPHDVARAKAGEHDLLFMGWAGDNGDPDNFLTPQFSCAAVQSGTNFARYCDPTLDKLITQGKAATTQAERTSLYQKAQAQIQQQALWLPLAHPTAAVLARQNVHGYAVSPFGRQDFSRVGTD